MEETPPDELQEIQDETLSTLLDACVNAHVITSQIQDGGRLLRKIRQLKDSYLSKKDDFFSTGSQSENVKRAIGDLHDALVALDEKIKSWRRSKIASFYPLRSTKRRKLEVLFADVQGAWNELILTLGYEKAEKSAHQASLATGNVAKIALASGHPDWEILSQDQAEQFLVQGDKYLFGYGVPRSNDTAFKRYMAAAKFGLPEACNMIGSMFENGLGREKDLPNAIFWYKSAAEKNHPDACNHIGRLYEQGKGLPKDYQKAAEYYLKAAEKNHPDSQTNLGGLYEKGLGQPMDYIKAANWYKIAVDQDHARAENALGSLYYRGLGVPLDANMAVSLFRKAASKGNPHAQNNLGICYEEGKGVVRDYVLAKQYYSQAASNNHASATNNYGFLLLLEKDFDEAISKFHLAKALKCIDATYNLGTVYENGLGVTPDMNMAMKYYKESSSQGYAKAQVKLAHLYCEGEHVERNYNIAFELFEKAAIQDNDEGQNGLGQFYELGLGAVNVSMPDAIKWYTKSSRQGNPVACYNLGNIYETGSGIDHPNLVKAIHYFREADRYGHPKALLKIKELESRKSKAPSSGKEFFFDEATQENDENNDEVNVSYSSLRV